LNIYLGIKGSVVKVRLTFRSTHYRSFQRRPRSKRPVTSGKRLHVQRSSSWIC